MSLYFTYPIWRGKKYITNVATNVMRFLLEALIYILIGNWFVLNSFKFLLGDVNTFNITEPHFAWHD